MERKLICNVWNPSEFRGSIVIFEMEMYKLNSVKRAINRLSIFRRKEIALKERGIYTPLY